jgi:hypothetical protein
MSIGNVNFDQIAEKDLTDHINVGVPEGLYIDYKRDLYGPSEGDKKEALKDISSFANSFGGHIIIGMEESNGIPTVLPGIKSGDPDKEILRLENLVRDGIEPRITGIKMRAINLSGGGFALIIRIPKSWNPPHRVSAKGVNRFYGRNSAGAHELSVEELRILFNLGANIHDRIRAFRIQRLGIISADEGPILIERGGRLILHVVPLSAFGQTQFLNVEQIHAQHPRFRLIYPMGMTPQFNFDGFINVGGGDRCYGYTQVFRNGIIEATKAALIREHEGEKLIPNVVFEKNILQALPEYLEGLRALDVPAPHIIMMSLQDVSGAILGVDRFEFFENPEPFKSELLLPEIVINDYGSNQDYQKAMRPAFDALWNAAGFSASPNFNAENIWVGR